MQWSVLNWVLELKGRLVDKLSYPNMYYYLGRQKEMGMQPSGRASILLKNNRTQKLIMRKKTDLSIFTLEWFKIRTLKDNKRQWIVKLLLTLKNMSFMEIWFQLSLAFYNPQILLIEWMDWSKTQNRFISTTQHYELEYSSDRKNKFSMLVYRHTQGWRQNETNVKCCFLTFQSQGMENWGQWNCTSAPLAESESLSGTLFSWSRL